MGETFSTLGIVGYDTEPIRNTLTEMGRPTDKIAIVFPGLGYTCQMPLLYYGTKVLLEKGYDVLWVEYNYNRDEYRYKSDDKKLEWQRFDAEAAFKAAMANKNYKKVLLMGKSLGTVALAHLASSHRDVVGKVIWLTPLLGHDDVYAKIKENAKDQLFIIGTRDPFFQKDRIDEIRNLGGKFTVVKDGDHSLEVEKDIGRSQEALRKVIGEVENFC